MSNILNRVYFATATTGTGAITVGAAESGFQLPDDALAQDGVTYSLLLEDGADWELSDATYDATGGTFTRDLFQSSTGSLLNLSGTAKASIVARTDNFLPTAQLTPIPASSRWRVRAPASSRGSTFGVGFSEVRFRDSGGNNLVTTVGGNGFASSSDSAGGTFAIQEAFDGSTAAGNGWYATQIQSTSFNAWLAFEFASPVTPVDIGLCVLNGFPDTLPPFVVVEFETPLGWMQAGTFATATGVDNTFQYFTLDTEYLAPAISATAGGPWFGKGFQFVGDSITFNTPGGIQWSDVALAQMGGYLVARDAVGGRRMQAGVTVVDGLSFDATDCLVVFLGTNDYGNAPETPLGAHGDAIGAGTFFGYVRDMVETVSTMAPRMRLIMMGPIQRKDVTGPNGLGFTLKDYSDAIQEVCADYGIAFVNCYAQAGFNTITLDTLSDDDLHPNAVGMPYLGRVAAAAFNRF